MNSAGRASVPMRPSLGATDERMVAHALAVASIFGKLRAIVGQLSGMLILLQARLARYPDDLPDIGIIRERRDEAVEHIAHLNPPPGHPPNPPTPHEPLGPLDPPLTPLDATPPP